MSWLFFYTPPPKPRGLRPLNTLSKREITHLRVRLSGRVYVCEAFMSSQYFQRVTAILVRLHNEEKKRASKKFFV